MSGYNRKFMSVEQGLQNAISDLRSKKIDFEKEIGRNEKYLRKCSDENDLDRNLDLKDAISIDKSLLSTGFGSTMLRVYQAQIDFHIKELHQSKTHEDIKNILFEINNACAKLITIVRESKEPSSDMGEEISSAEKSSIYKSIKEIEDKISSIKINIGSE